MFAVSSSLYKGYILSKTLEEIQVGNEVEDVNTEVSHIDNMSSSKMKR